MEECIRSQHRVTGILRWQCSGLSPFLLTPEYLRTLMPVTHRNRSGMGLYTCIPASGRLRQGDLEIKATTCNAVGREGGREGRQAFQKQKTARALTTRHLLFTRKTFFLRNKSHVQTYSQQ